ncbi:hypothetical protein DPMN_013545 [Dreissena polymorpha]|uniref:Uncharacterized protein n=1 Tax=Dreissena polymorpha TaxID=45954 RepID=A0A9D4N4F6_DREPO|nr:hypothetical protein DPMN_013545 [Dreissena polymorpha]
MLSEQGNFFDEYVGPLSVDQRMSIHKELPAYTQCFKMEKMDGDEEMCSEFELVMEAN